MVLEPCKRDKYATCRRSRTLGRSHGEIFYLYMKPEIPSVSPFDLFAAMVITTWMIPSTKNRNITNVRRNRRCHSFLFKSWTYNYSHSTSPLNNFNICDSKQPENQRIPICCIEKRIRFHEISNPNEIKTSYRSHRTYSHSFGLCSRSSFWLMFSVMKFVFYPFVCLFCYAICFSHPFCSHPSTSVAQSEYLNL